MDAKLILIAALTLIMLFYFFTWWTTAKQKLDAGEHGHHEPVMPTPLHLAIGFVTNFFDTLGIGSYATTTSAFKFWKLVPDQQIPGTLNTGHVLPTVEQAVLFMTAVAVDARTLVLMIGAACAGAWLGAGIVSGFSRRPVQIGLGSALLFAATIVLAQLLNVVPGGTALGLTGVKLVIGVGANFVLGALMT